MLLREVVSFFVWQVADVVFSFGCIGFGLASSAFQSLWKNHEMNPIRNYLFSNSRPSENGAVQPNQATPGSGASDLEEKTGKQLPLINQKAPFEVTNQGKHLEPTFKLSVPMINSDFLRKSLNLPPLRMDHASFSPSSLRPLPRSGNPELLQNLLKKRGNRERDGNDESSIEQRLAKRVNSGGTIAQLPDRSNAVFGAAGRLLGESADQLLEKLSPRFGKSPMIGEPVSNMDTQQVTLKARKGKNNGINTDRLGREDAINISKRLFERLDREYFLIYGSVARMLSGNEEIEDFGDIDIVTAKELYEASDAFSTALNELGVKYSSSRKSEFIIEVDDKKYKIELVDKESKQAYPVGKEFKDKYRFAESVMEQAKDGIWCLRREFIREKGIPAKEKEYVPLQFISLEGVLGGLK